MMHFVTIFMGKQSPVDCEAVINCTTLYVVVQAVTTRLTTIVPTK